MPQPVIMPVAEVADRYTISRLKAERLNIPEMEEGVMKALRYYEAGLDLANPDLAELVEELYRYNRAIWDLEHALRVAGQNVGDTPLEQIGQVALDVRRWNNMRVAVKNKISRLTGDEFVDAKF